MIEFSIQKALYSALSQAASATWYWGESLMTFGSDSYTFGGTAPSVAAFDVYGNPPYTANGDLPDSFPYAYLGEATHTPDDEDCNAGFESTSTIHTWSDSRLNLYTMQSKIRDLLHRQSITVDGHTLLDCIEEFSESTNETDQIFHGIQRYRLITRV